MELKMAMHNWMRAEPIETTIARLARSGYDGIEISGEPITYDADEVKRLLDHHGLSCWGSVTLMTGGRDLVHEDHYVRQASVQYVKDCLSFVSSMGGSILTVVPSTVGKVTPMGSPEDEWNWCVEGLKECQTHAEEVGVRIELFPLLRSVRPADLNATLNALATALQGRGEQLGETLDKLDSYLGAIDDHLPTLRKDLVLLAQVADLQASYLHQVEALPDGRPPSAALREVRWLLEEYRVSLWAQQLGTAQKVSDQRIRKALAAAAGRDG